MRKLLIGLVALAFVGGFGGLFSVQNAARTTNLSLDLYFFAWQLAEPVQIPILMLVCAAVGFIVGYFLPGPFAYLRARKLRMLQEQLDAQGNNADGGQAW